MQYFHGDATKTNKQQNQESASILDFELQALSLVGMVIIHNIQIFHIYKFKYKYSYILYTNTYIHNIQIQTYGNYF